jgi:hypothetical protein
MTHAHLSIVMAVCCRLDHPWPGAIAFWLLFCAPGFAMRVMMTIVALRIGLGFVHFLYDRWVYRLSDPQVREDHRQGHLLRRRRPIRVIGPCDGANRPVPPGGRLACPNLPILRGPHAAIQRQQLPIKPSSRKCEFVNKIHLRAISSVCAPPWGPTVISRKPQFLANSVMKASW